VLAPDENTDPIFAFIVAKARVPSMIDFGGGGAANEDIGVFVSSILFLGCSGLDLGDPPLRALVMLAMLEMCPIGIE